MIWRVIPAKFSLLEVKTGVASLLDIMKANALMDWENALQEDMKKKVKQS